jgi:hypothetical protein
MHYHLELLEDSLDTLEEDFLDTSVEECLTIMVVFMEDTMNGTTAIHTCTTTTSGTLTTIIHMGVILTKTAMQKTQRPPFLKAGLLLLIGHFAIL